MLKRSTLPYRKNCEGYFLYDSNQVLAQQTNEGVVIFPGGGVDNEETPEAAIKRETLEETGAIIENLQKTGVIRILWGPTWAKTEKQRKRYLEFQGDEMHLFIGKVAKLAKPLGDKDNKEAGWSGKRLMSVDKTIKLINAQRPFSEDIKEYREKQLKILQSLM